MEFTSIGKNIRKYRKQRGLTQEALAEKVGLHTGNRSCLPRYPAKSLYPSMGPHTGLFKFVFY